MRSVSGETVPQMEGEIKLIRANKPTAFHIQLANSTAKRQKDLTIATEITSVSEKND